MNMSSRQDLLHGELLAHLGDDVKNLGYLRQDGLALGTEGRWKPFSTSPPSKEACSLPETPADRDTNQKGRVLSASPVSVPFIREGSPARMSSFRGAS